MIFEEAWGQLITITFETTSCDANVHIYDIYKVDRFKGGTHLQDPTQKFWARAYRDPHAALPKIKQWPNHVVTLENVLYEGQETFVPFVHVVSEKSRR